MLLSKRPIFILCTIFSLVFLPIILKHVIIVDSLDEKKESILEETRTFWAYSYLIGKYFQVKASLLGTGNFCYIYMDEECIPKIGKESIMAKIATICNEFDNIIYPRIIDLAGHPNGTMGDIDGDPRIFILFLDCYNYYSEVNDIEHNVSNHCEMIYISYQLYRHQWLYPTIAHEFHHLIWFNNEWGEPPFTLEALAQYAIYHAGYLGPYENLVPQTASYLPHPENSPLYWTNDQDYGSTYLFAFYIAEKYGVQILRDLIKEPLKGPEGIEVVLKAAGYNITFNELFMNWITALTIDKIGFENDIFGFVGLDARISNHEIIDDLPVINKSTPLNHYAFHIYKIESATDNFTFIVNKLPEQVIGIIFAVHDLFGWHIDQELQFEELDTISLSFSGSMIDEAYIITSYISENTPIAPNTREQGPSIAVEISIQGLIQESSNSTSVTTIESLPTTETIIWFNFFYFLISLIVIMKVKRNNLKKSV